MIKCPICQSEVKEKKKEGHDLLYACTHCMGQWSLDPNSFKTEHDAQKIIMEVERKKVLFKTQKKFKGEPEQKYKCPICGHVCTPSQMSTDSDYDDEDNFFIVEYICPKCGEIHGTLEEWNEYTESEGDVREDL